MFDQISVQKRKDIKAAIERGDSSRTIASEHGVSKSTVNRYARKFNTYCKHMAGRPSKIGKRSIVTLARLFKTGKISNAVNVARTIATVNNITIVPTTVSRILKSKNLVARKKKKAIPMSRDLKKKRLAFARKYASWSEADWEKVIFADESRITRFGSDGGQWVWGERNRPRREHEYSQVPKGKGGSVAFWGCITAQGVGYLSWVRPSMDADLYLDIMNDEFQQTLDWYNWDRSKILLLQDKDPKHTAKKSMKWYKDNNVTLLDWPTGSPDLNPIENMWSFLKQELGRIYPEPAKSLRELWERIEVTWDRPIMHELAKKVIHSMPRRCAAIIEKKGGRIPY